VPDRPVLTFVVLPPNQSMEDDKKTTQLIESMTRQYGSSGRTFKNALVWCLADNTNSLYAHLGRCDRRTQGGSLRRKTFGALNYL
jgi:hypothetical protein